MSVAYQCFYLTLLFVLAVSLLDNRKSWKDKKKVIGNVIVMIVCFSLFIYLTG